VPGSDGVVGGAGASIGLIPQIRTTGWRVAASEIFQSARTIGCAEVLAEAEVRVVGGEHGDHPLIALSDFDL